MRVWEDDTLLGFEVTDDGAGFDPAGTRQGGHGFVNMTDRLGAFGGTLVESTPGHGTTITGTIPLDAPAAPATR